MTVVFVALPLLFNPLPKGKTGRRTRVRSLEPVSFGCPPLDTCAIVTLTKTKPARPFYVTSFSRVGRLYPQAVAPFIGYVKAGDCCTPATVSLYTAGDCYATATP